MADKLLKSIKFPTLPDRYVIGDSTLTEEGAAAEAKAVGDALATKADTKGTYEDLIVGGAEQLMSDEYETDKEPYLFRATGGSADVGNREYLDKIVGGTVAWNQLVPAMEQGSWVAENGVTISFDNNAIVVSSTTINNGAYAPARNSITSGHKYLCRFKAKAAQALSTVIVGGLSSTGITKGVSVTENWQEFGYVAQCTASATATKWYCYARNTAYSNLMVKDFDIFDLTAMFNPTIADYIYTLEQSQAGAGVAWFKNYFPNDYYPYDPGTLRSVEGVSAHETVGFNQWDEEWESGYITNTGGEGADSQYVRSANYIPIFPNTNYYFKKGETPTTVTVAYYDADKNFIERVNQSWSYRVETTPVNAHYMRFYYFGTTYNNDICINLSDPTRNGEYEPYQKHTYPLDSSLTLRGVPKLADGKLAFDGDVYESDGTVTRKYGVKVFDGTTGGWSEYQGAFYQYFTGYAKRANSTDAAISDRLQFVKENAGISALFDAGRGTFSFRYDQDSIQIYPTDSTIDTSAKLNAYLASNPLTVVYELATTTTETADGYEQYQRCDPSGTEEFVTTGIVPVGHETRYPHDLKKKIETAPDSPSADGTYLMKRSGGKNSYMALPSTPSANGSYVLTVTVSGGSASYSWTAKE